MAKSSKDREFLYEFKDASKWTKEYFKRLTEEEMFEKEKKLMAFGPYAVAA